MDTQKAILNALTREFQARQTRNPAYSLRSFARDLGVQPSGLSEILNGKRGITRRTGQKVLAKLPVAAEGASHLLMALKGRNRRIAKEYVVLDRDVFLLISEWQYFAMISLVDTCDFREDVSWIAGRLGITQRQVRSTIERLERLGLLLRDEVTGRLKTSGQPLATTTDIPDLAIQRSHEQNLRLASRALGAVSVEERDFGIMTLAIDPRKLKEAKSRIRAFRRELSAFLESGSDRTEVYRFSTQLFPLTKKRKIK